MTLIARLLFIVFIGSASLSAEVISREGNGFLEEREGQLVLHVKGTPYEMGFQHGKLLKDKIAINVGQFVESKPKSELAKDQAKEFFKALPQIKKHVSSTLMQEMQGIADGSGIPLDKIVLANLFPEMFHCLGMTVSNTVTKDGKLYHVRVLDYRVGKGLQNTAVLIVAEPSEGIPFLNVSYAGFIGTITGMNQEKISIGEIGGMGYGLWDGVPMAFLLREVLQNAHTLDEAKEMLKAAQRTCEYYYIIADGKSGQSLGFYATTSQLGIVEPGAPYALLAPKGLPKNYGNDGKNDKFFLSGYEQENSEYQTAIYRDATKKEVVALFHQQPKDCLVLTGFSNPMRYPILIDRLMKNSGKVTVSDIQEMIKSPVTCETNLHNAIFLPEDLTVWISHAGANEEPASEEKYYEFNLNELIK